MPSDRQRYLAHPARLAEGYSEGNWESAAHLELLSRTLRRQLYEPLRLMVAMPPRHGKSELASTWQPFWLLCRNPSKRVLLASYGADFAARWGRRVRELVQERGGEFGVKLLPSSRSVSRWDTTEGGGMVCVGVGGSLTGRGADLLIIDDPVKSSAEAVSPVYRERLWDWYRSTARTRLEPGGSVILIMSRWHENDLAGMLLDDDYGESWETLRLPALAESGDVLGRSEGESLWPARFDVRALSEAKAELGSYYWQAMYQQSPQPPAGGMFARHWWQIADAPAPEGWRRARFWDMAATTSSSSDYTAGALVAFQDGVYTIENVVRLRGSPLDVERTIAATAARDGVGVSIRWEEEPGSSGKIVTDHLRRRVLAGYDAKGVRSTGAKTERWRVLAAAAEAGNVWLTRGNWVADFTEEAASAPTGAHDDQLDAAAGAVLEVGRREFHLV